MYKHQLDLFCLICIKCGKSTSQYFSIANGVRQGSILFPKLFALYMDGLSGAFSLYKADCYINDQCMDRLIYADDICVMATMYVLHMVLQIT